MFDSNKSELASKLVATDNNFLTLSELASKTDIKELTIRRRFKNFIKSGEFRIDIDYIKENDRGDDLHFVYKINSLSFKKLFKIPMTDSKVDSKEAKTDSSLIATDSNHETLKVENKMLKEENQELKEDKQFFKQELKTAMASITETIKQHGNFI